jgi:hypothetical protein
MVEEVEIPGVPTEAVAIGQGREVVTTVVFLDSFSSGLDELTRKQQADPGFVLEFLSKAKRFSVFEVTANQTIAKTVTKLLCDVDMIAKKGEKFGDGPLLKRTGGAYPWTRVDLTEAGEAFLKKEKSS